MELTQEQLAHFRAHGYVAVPRFFDARETAAMRAEINRLKSEGLIRNVSTDGDGKTASKTMANLQMVPMSHESPLFRALPFVPKVVNAISTLIGDPVVLHLDQCFVKPAHHGAGTNWHQDNGYFKIADPWKGVAMWIAIHDATVANGTMHLIPDSVHEAYEHSRDGESDVHLRCYPPEERAIPVEVPAGGVLFFAYGVPHCTRGNQTDRERAGVAYHFLNEDQVTEGYFGPLGIMKHPHLSGPASDGGLTAYGQPITGTWDAEVARLL